MKRHTGLERFWDKVDTSGHCWLWTGKKNAKGYGMLRTGYEDNARAHRVVWEMENGEIPDGMHVLHVCDNPACVRPNHLFLGTNADNVADRQAKGRQAKGEKQGHAKLTEPMVMMIKMFLARGLPQRRIADMFGVHAGTISPIATGRTWRHV